MTRTALVTGATGGLGLSIAGRLAAAGHRVVLNGIEPAETGDAAARTLADTHGVETGYLRADLADPAQIAEMHGRLEERGGVDILVNNAVIRHFSPIEDFAPEDWDHSISVNLNAPFHLARLLLPGMKRRGWGRIINISSYYGFRGAENRIDYVTTKTALTGMARAIAIETARHGITANAICPGSVGTDAILNRIRSQCETSGEDFETAARAYAAARNPMERFVASDSIGDTVAFLCSDAASDISGTTLPVDGGWLAA